MMRKVERDEILDYQTWTEKRPQQLPRILEEKRKRRVHVGGDFTLLFENPVTVRYQVQEMMRVERMVKESDIRFELETYNELLGGPGELGATLLIELDDPAERARRLVEWVGVQERIFVEVEAGERVFATFDPRQVGADRVSSVQFLKFATRGRVPVAVGVDFPGLQFRTELAPEQRSALGDDLKN